MVVPFLGRRFLPLGSPASAGLFISFFVKGPTPSRNRRRVGALTHAGLTGDQIKAAAAPQETPPQGEGRGGVGPSDQRVPRLQTMTAPPATSRITPAIHAASSQAR